MEWNNLLAPLLWVLWCALHSTLIAAPVTDLMKKKLGLQFRFYRLFYNTVALVTLIPLAAYSLSIDQEPVFRWEGYWKIGKYLLLITSFFLFTAGGRHYSLGQLLGVRQIKTGRTGQLLSEFNTFDSSGVLGVIRHPWYTAGILLVWAGDMGLSALLINIVISAYFVIGTILEERKLLLAFGESYRKYQGNVSMFIPFKWLKAKFTPMSG